MDQVNQVQGNPAVKKRRAGGRAKLPEDRRRVILYVRVLPATKGYLEKMGYGSCGRAVDVLVKAFQHDGIRDMIDSKEEFSIVDLSK